MKSHTKEGLWGALGVGLSFVLLFAVNVFFLAPKKLFEAEKAKTAAAEAALTQERDRQLIPAIEELAIHESNRLVQIMIRVGVRNAGRPSIADVWRLNIKAMNIVNLEPFKITGTIEMTDQFKRPVKIAYADLAPQKMSKPIEEGGYEWGWLVFLIPGTTSETVQRAFDGLSVTFHDVKRVTHEILLQPSVMTNTRMLGNVN